MHHLIIIIWLNGLILKYWDFAKKNQKDKNIQKTRIK